MILKDDEYIKRNMLTVYYKHEAKYLNQTFYRFMGEQEFVTLLKNNIMYFTNPIEWKKSNTGDENETYFEDWFTDSRNISNAYQIIKKKIEEREGQYCSYQSILAVYSGFVAAAALLQQTNFCYCVTNVCGNRKMIEEYHEKYKRNIIVKFKKDFYRKMAVLDKGDWVPHGTYLYADVMPMVYIRNFEDFIKTYLYGSYLSGDIAKNAFDYGAFLKHVQYSYEQETRIKLRMHLEEGCNMQVLANEFYRNNCFPQEEAELIENSMKFIEKNKLILNQVFEDVREKIKKIGNKQCFELEMNEFGIKDIVESILLHQNASDEEKKCVYFLANANGITVNELDFNMLPYMWF